MKKELFKFISVIGDQGLKSVATFLTTLVLARISSQTDYANFILLTSGIVFFSGIQSSLISKPFSISINDFDENDKIEYFSANVLFSFFFQIVVILSAVLYIVFNSDLDFSYFFYGLMFLVGSTSFFLIRELLLSERKIMDNLKYGLFSSFSIITVLAYIYINKSVSISIFLVTASLVYFLVSTHFLYSIKGQLKLEFTKAMVYFKINWKLGRWLLGSNFFYHITYQIFPWLLLFMETKAEIALFGILTSISSLVNPVLNSLNSYLLPLFVKSNNNLKSFKELFNKWSLFFLVVAFGLTIIGVFFGNDIIKMFFGNKYSNLGLIAILPFINQGINIVFHPYKIAFLALKKTDISFWLLCFRSIVTVCLGYCLVLNYGIIGVFYTKIIESLVYNLTQMVVYNRVYSKMLKCSFSTLKVEVD